MNSNSPDVRRKRKALERQRALMMLAIVAVLCVSTAILVFAYTYAGQNLIPTDSNLPANRTPTPLNLPAQTSSTQASMPVEMNPPTPIPPQAEFPLSDGQLVSMSLPDKIGQMMMVGVDGMELSPLECEGIKQLAPGGVAFHGGNITSPEQLTKLINELKNCLGTDAHPPMFFAVDHEGQYINRFESGVTVFPCTLALGATNDPALVEQSARSSGQELSSMGINLILGPVADVLTNTDNLVIGERSFGGDPQRVGSLIAASVKGYREAGLIPVLKHFPGHGGVSADSHNALPVDNADLSTLSSMYLPPFQQGLSAGAPVVMLSHISFPQIDASGLPASLSKPSIDLLRGQLGFNGVVLTDDLNMGALQKFGRDVPARALQSARAGSDMLLILPLADALAAKKQIQTAVEQGTIPLEQINNSALRILRLKEQQGMLQGYPAPAQPDWTADANLAYSVGYHAPAVLKTEGGLIPIPSTVKRILVIAPQDALGLDAMLNAELQAHGFETQFLNYYAPWSGGSGDAGMVRTFAAQTSSFDLTIVFTWQAHYKKVSFGDAWQGSLVNAILQNNTPLIVVSLKSPVDILEFPAARNYLATFGTTSGQLQALADILTGDSQPLGINPFPQLP